MLIGGTGELCDFWNFNEFHAAGANMLGEQANAGAYAFAAFTVDRRRPQEVAAMPSRNHC